MKLRKKTWISVLLATLRVVTKIFFVVLDIAASFAIDERKKPPYTAIHAHQLHEDGLISDEEYMRCMQGRD